MADAKESKVRTFVKDGPNGQLTRQVTSAQTEVEARFDGFTEQAGSGTKAAGGATTPAKAASSGS